MSILNNQVLIAKINNEIEVLKKDIQQLTKEFQLEFEKINEFMGCLCDKLSELHSRIESFEKIQFELDKINDFSRCLNDKLSAIQTRIQSLENPTANQKGETIARN